MWYGRRMRRWLPALALVGGCKTWGATHESPADVVGNASAKPVRVTTTDGRVMVLNGAQLVGDSIIGVESRHSTRVALDTLQVKRVETRQYDMAGTFLALLGFLGLEVLFSDHG